MHKRTAVESLRALGDFDNPAAIRTQIDALTKEILEFEASNPGVTFRVSEDGPEETALEILVRLGREEAELRAIREALDHRSGG